jgi:hypothetical protein
MSRIYLFGLVAGALLAVMAGVPSTGSASERSGSIRWTHLFESDAQAVAATSRYGAPESRLQKQVSSAVQAGVYQPADVHKLFELKRVQRIHFSTDDMSFRAEYLLTEAKTPVLFVQGLNNFNKEYQGLPPNDSRLVHRFREAVDDDLLMRVCGERMADDSCDYFSPLGRSTTTGTEISQTDRQICRDILEALAEALKGLPDPQR